MNAIKLNEIKLACRELSNRNNNVYPFPSLIDQLDYLIDLEAGKTKDASRLKDIIIGVLAAREIENYDEELASDLHEVSAWVDQLMRARK